MTTKMPVFGIPEELALLAVLVGKGEAKSRGASLARGEFAEHCPASKPILPRGFWKMVFIFLKNNFPKL